MPDSRMPTLDSAFAANSCRLVHDERPPHRVFVDSFELAVHPITRAEYARLVAATGHDEPGEWSHPLFAQPDLPVVGVSWLDAVDYVRGDRQKKDAPCGRRRKRNGNMPREDDKQRFFRGAT